MISTLAHAQLTLRSMFSAVRSQASSFEGACLEPGAGSLLFIALGCAGSLAALQVFRHPAPLGRVPRLPLLPGLLRPAARLVTGDRGAHRQKRGVFLAGARSLCHPLLLSESLAGWLLTSLLRPAAEPVIGDRGSCGQRLVSLAGARSLCHPLLLSRVPCRLAPY